MKRTIWLWQLMGFAVSSFLGTILHFLYEWLGKSPAAAFFSGVNESTWEHMKLLFWPMLLYAVVQSFFFKSYDSFICVKTRGILLGISLIPILFYTYNGVIGKSPDLINIAIFFISAAATYIYESRALKKNTIRCNQPRLAILILCSLALAFVIFTFKTPSLSIFEDPITKNYGM